MEHKMIRSDRQMDQTRAREVLAGGEYAVLALVDAEGQPYGVPISFAVEGDHAYFHGSMKGGYKYEAMAANPRASLTVVMNTNVRPKSFTTAFDSAIAFGRIRLAADDAERREGLMALLRKYCPDNMEAGQRYIDGMFHKTQVMVLDIDHVTGKHHD